MKYAQRQQLATLVVCTWWGLKATQHGETIMHAVPCAALMVMPLAFSSGACSHETRHTNTLQLSAPDEGSCLAAASRAIETAMASVCVEFNYRCLTQHALTLHLLTRTLSIWSYAMALVAPPVSARICAHTHTYRPLVSHSLSGPLLCDCASPTLADLVTPSSCGIVCCVSCGALRTSNLCDGCGQSCLPVVDVADGADV